MVANKFGQENKISLLNYAHNTPDRNHVRNWIIFLERVSNLRVAGLIFCMEYEVKLKQKLLYVAKSSRPSADNKDQQRMIFLRL